MRNSILRSIFALLFIDAPDAIAADRAGSQADEDAEDAAADRVLLEGEGVVAGPELEDAGEGSHLSKQMKIMNND